MYNSTKPRLGRVMPSPRQFSPSTLVSPYPLGFSVSQLKDGPPIAKQKLLTNFEVIFRDPEKCIQAHRAGALDPILDLAASGPVLLRRLAMKALRRFAVHDACRRLLLMSPEEQQQHRLLLLLQQQIAVQQHLQLPAIPRDQQQQLQQRLQSLQQQQMQLMESPPQQMLIPLLQCINAPDEETREAFIDFACAIAASKQEKVFPADSYTESYVSLVLQETEEKWRQEQEQQQQQQGEGQQQQAALMQQLLQMQEQRRQLESMQQQLRSKQKEPQVRDSRNLSEACEEKTPEPQNTALERRTLGGMDESLESVRIASMNEEGPAMSAETVFTTLRFEEINTQESANSECALMPPFCIDGHFGFVLSEAFTSSSPYNSIAHLFVVGQYGFVEASLADGSSSQGLLPSRQLSAAPWVDGQFGFVRNYSDLFGFPSPIEWIDGQFGFVRNYSDWQTQQSLMLLQMLPRAPDAVFGSYGFVSPFDGENEELGLQSHDAGLSEEGDFSRFEAVFGAYGFVSYPSHAQSSTRSVLSPGSASGDSHGSLGAARAVDEALASCEVAGRSEEKKFEISEMSTRGSALPCFVGVDGFYGTVREDSQENSALKDAPLSQEDTHNLLVMQLQQLALRRPQLQEVPPSDWMFFEVLDESHLATKDSDSSGSKTRPYCRVPMGAPRRWLAAELLSGKCLKQQPVSQSPAASEVPFEEEKSAKRVVEEETSGFGVTAPMVEKRVETLAVISTPLAPPSRIETAALLQLLHALAASCGGALDVVADLRAFALKNIFDRTFAVDVASIVENPSSVGRLSNASPEKATVSSVAFDKSAKRSPSPLPPAPSPFAIQTAEEPLSSLEVVSSSKGGATKKTVGRGEVGDTAWTREAPFRPLPPKHRQPQLLVVPQPTASSTRPPSSSASARMRVRSASPSQASKLEDECSSKTTSMGASQKALTQSTAGKSSSTSGSPSTASAAHGRKRYLLQVLRLLSLVGSFRPEKQHVFHEAELLPRMEALLALLLESTAGANNNSVSLTRKETPAPKTGGQWLTVSLHPMTVPTVWDCGKQQLLQHRIKADESILQLTANYKNALFSGGRGPPAPPACAYGTERLLLMSCICCYCMKRQLANPSEGDSQSQNAQKEELPTSLAHLAAAACLLEQEPSNLNVALQLAGLLSERPSLRQVLRPALYEQLQQQVQHLELAALEAHTLQEQRIEMQTAQNARALLSALSAKQPGEHRASTRIA